ncbi:MAG: hypothetical protein IJ899_09720, partial [Blautia sp.]|nr:hypothetical protein [Blautia sp.]
GDKRSCKNELAHFCMRLGRPQTRGSSHFALFILNFANLSVQNERIPSGCKNEVKISHDLKTLRFHRRVFLYIPRELVYDDFVGKSFS